MCSNYVCQAKKLSYWYVYPVKKKNKSWRKFINCLFGFTCAFKIYRPLFTIDGKIEPCMFQALHSYRHQTHKPLGKIRLHPVSLVFEAVWLAGSMWSLAYTGLYTQCAPVQNRWYKLPVYKKGRMNCNFIWFILLTCLVCTEFVPIY